MISDGVCAMESLLLSSSMLSSSPLGSIGRVANDLQLRGVSFATEPKLKVKRPPLVLRLVEAYIGVNPVDILVSHGSVTRTSSSSTRCFVFSKSLESQFFREGNASDYLVIVIFDFSSSELRY